MLLRGKLLAGWLADPDPPCCHRYYPPQDIEGVRPADGGWFVVQSRPQVMH